MPASRDPVSVTRSLKLVVARWSKELNTCRMPQGEGRGVMWGLWTFLPSAWHHVVVIVPCRQPQLTNCQNQGGRTTIQTKWWWDLSLQHFGGIDFNSTGWNFKTSAKFGCFTQRDLAELSWRSEVESKILLVVMVRLILKIYAQQSNIWWWRKHIHPEPPGFHLRFMLPSGHQSELQNAKLRFEWQRMYHALSNKHPLLSGQEGWVEHATFGVGWTFSSGTRFKRTVSLWASLMVRRCGFGYETSR